MAEIKFKNGEAVTIGENNMRPVEYIFEVDENDLFVVKDPDGKEVFCCPLSELLYFKLG